MQSQSRAIEDSLTWGTGTWMRPGEQCIAKRRVWLDQRADSRGTMWFGKSWEFWARLGRVRASTGSLTLTTTTTSPVATRARSSIAQNSKRQQLDGSQHLSKFSSCYFDHQQKCYHARARHGDTNVRASNTRGIVVSIVLYLCRSKFLITKSSGLNLSVPTEQASIDMNSSDQ